MKIHTTDFSEKSGMLSSDRNEPTDIFIDFERAAVNTVTNQIPQLQVLKINFNLIYSSCVFIST